MLTYNCRGVVTADHTDVSETQTNAQHWRTHTAPRVCSHTASQKNKHAVLARHLPFSKRSTPGPPTLAGSQHSCCTKPPSQTASRPGSAAGLKLAPQSKFGPVFSQRNAHGNVFITWFSSCFLIAFPSPGLRLEKNIYTYIYNV